MAEPQKSVPNPINKSLEIYPTKTLKILNINKGKVNFQEPSWALKIIFLFPLGWDKKTKKRTRTE